MYRVETYWFSDPPKIYLFNTEEEARTFIVEIESRPCCPWWILKQIE